MGERGKPPKEKGEQYMVTRRATMRVKAYFIWLAGVVVAALLLLNGCIQQHSPLRVVSVSASSEPAVGQVVTLRVEVISTEDEPELEIGVDVPEGVKLIGGAEPAGGAIILQGTLQADQPQVYEVQVCVLYEGAWRIGITVVSKLDKSNVHLDNSGIYLVSTHTSGSAIPSDQYHENIPASPRPPLPETPPAGICP